MLDKDKINQLFRNLRKEGFIARQNYLCCRRCAGSQIACDIKDMAQGKRNGINGCIFYTRQDADNIQNGFCYLSYGSVGVTDIGEIGLTTLEVGNRLVQHCRKVGLNYDGDDNPDSRIMLTDKPIGHEKD